MGVSQGVPCIIMLPRPFSQVEATVGWRLWHECGGFRFSSRGFGVEDFGFTTFLQTVPRLEVLKQHKTNNSSNHLGFMMLKSHEVQLSSNHPPMDRNDPYS